ncbi:MAG: hypothetical protein NWR42_08835, partial [Desulfobacterales bacterium]|nr:hypothetical protein [Desulfobacterales bacterium]
LILCEEGLHLFCVLLGFEFSTVNFELSTLSLSPLCRARPYICTLSAAFHQFPFTVQFNRLRAKKSQPAQRAQPAQPAKRAKPAQPLPMLDKDGGMCNSNPLSCILTFPKDIAWI